jgi:RNA polymerase sigma-70 factor, ECF subfamily
VERAEALDLAVLTVLERLSGTERAAYVLREAFEYPYKRISHVLEVSEMNARQLVTRARSRLSSDHRSAIIPREHQQLLDAFVGAAQTGDLARLERTLTVGLAPCSQGTNRRRTARISAVESRDRARLPAAVAA